MSSTTTRSTPDPAQGPGQALRFAGLRFTPMSMDEAMAAIAARPADAPFDYVSTPNAEAAYLRRHDPEFRLANDGSFVSLNDSRVLRLASRLGGADLRFAPGAYIVRRLFDEVIGPDEAITIIGCTDEVVDRLRRRYRLARVAHHNPPMGFIRDAAAVDAAIDFTIAHPGRFVFVAMGPPQSELFCHRLKARGGARGLGLCIGSSIAVVSGEMKPAPDLMERTGLVWLYRLVREPRRLWRRYLVRAMFGLGLGLRDALRLRLGLEPRP